MAQKYSTQFAVAQWPRNSQQGEKITFMAKIKLAEKKVSNSNNNYEKYVTKVERERRRRRRKLRCRSLRMRGNNDSSSSNSNSNNNSNDNAKKWPLKLPGKWQKAEA